MVAICKGSSIWVAIQREKRMSCGCCPLAAEDESFEIPSEFWVIKARKEELFLVEVNSEGMKFLISFTKKSDAINFLRSQHFSVPRFRCLHFYFSELEQRVKGLPYAGVKVYGCKKILYLPF